MPFCLVEAAPPDIEAMTSYQQAPVQWLLLPALANLSCQSRNVLRIVKHSQRAGAIVASVATDGFLHFIAVEQVAIFGYQP